MDGKGGIVWLHNCPLGDAVAFDKEVLLFLHILASLEVIFPFLLWEWLSRLMVFSVGNGIVGCIMKVPTEKLIIPYSVWSAKSTSTASPPKGFTGTQSSSLSTSSLPTSSWTSSVIAAKSKWDCRPKISSG
ncbi:hypothetical protein EV2_038940 [Malus domestica]